MWHCNHSAYSIGLLVLSLLKQCYGEQTEPDTGPIFFLEPPSNVLIDSVVGASLSCSAHGKPAPVMDWERANGSAIPYNPDYIKIHPNNSLQFLPFQGPLISSIHRSAFRCVAKNSVGKVVSRSVHVKTVIAADYNSDRYNVYTQDAWVMRGNTAVFTCDIRPSFVRPYINIASWYIDDRQVVSDERHILFDDALHITNVTEAHNGKQIKCVTNNLMANNLRVSSRKKTLHVITQTVQTTPNIEYRKESITVQSGSKVVIPCVAHAFPIANYVWSNNGARVRHSVRVQQLRGDLEIMNTTSDDSGMYLCNASNIHGFDIINTHLLVTTPLMVQMIPRSQKIDAMLPANISCMVDGGPYSDIVWYKDGSQLVFSNNTRQIDENTVGIRSVSRRDIGMYQCLVSAVTENIQASSQLELGVSAPLFHDTMAAEFKHPGEKISLRCQVYGNPPPTVSWKLADQSLQSQGDRVKIGWFMTAEGDVVSYVNITSLQITDGGRYLCVANNSIGYEEQPAQLNVYGPPTVRRMENKTAVANKTLTLTCHVSGYPIEMITWSKDGRPIRMDHRITSSVSGQVVIHSVTATDEGWYNCTANNTHSQGSSATVYVSVITEPVLQPISFPPLVQGDPHVVICVVKDGDRPITLSWYKDNKLVTDFSNPSITVKANPPLSSTLEFSSVHPSDVANYTCVASNRAGVVNTTAQLSTVNVKPYWITRPSDDSVTLNSVKLLSCQGGGTPSPTVTWKIATDYSTGEYREIGDTDISHYDILSNGSLLVKSARLEDDGYYLCQIDNGIGPGISETVLLDVNVPASYSENQTSKYAQVGDNLSLSCEATGDKPLATTWSLRKVGESQWIQIQTSTDDRLAINAERTEEGMRSILSMTDASRADSGDYWCTCKNQYGHSTRRITLSVRETPQSVDQLTVTAKRSRGVSLSWLMTDDGNSPVTQYIIQYTQLTDEWRSPEQADSDKPQVMISGLSPHTEYKFRVIAINEVGRSVPSYEVVATTIEERPSGSPQNVTLTPKSCTTIRVSWKPPVESELHGVLLGYRVGYNELNSSADYTYVTLSPPTLEHSFLLSNLEVNSSYSVIVSAFNIKGNGPNSEPRATYTFEDVPSEAPKQVVGIVSQQTIRVEWKRPELKYLYGQLSGYKVIIHSVNKQQDETNQMILQTKDLFLIISDLYIYTNYSIQVLAFTEFGDGVRSDPIYINTPQAAPGAPASVKAATVNSTSVMLSWLPPSPSNGVLQQYMVTVFSGPKQVRNITLRAPGLTQHILINDLVQGQVYGFKVKAKNYQTRYGADTDEATATPASNAAPSILLREEKVEVKYHEALTLSCPVVADPTPLVSWTKSSVGEMPDHFSFLDNGTLYVEHILKQDTAIYTCSAATKYGEVKANFNINVIDLPTPPKLSIVKLRPSAVQISWVTTGNGGFDVNGFSLEIRNTSKWERINIASHRRSHWFRHLACGQSYDIRMRTNNAEGSSDYSQVTIAKTLGGKPIAASENLLINRVNNTSLFLDLASWSNNGCPIKFFSISYTNIESDKTILLGSISSSQNVVLLADLEAGSWYNVEITAHSSAGSTTQSVTVSTLTSDGLTIAPLHHIDATLKDEKPTIALLVTLSVTALATLIIILACFLYFKRRRDRVHYKTGSKSRHSMFSDTSDLDPHHPARTNFTMPRENMSGDSRVWLLHHHPISALAGINSALSETDTVTPDKADGESQCTVKKRVSITEPAPPSRGTSTLRDSSVSPYAMFIYASARSGDYESCTPTLSFARARLNRDGIEGSNCEHNIAKDYCPYCYAGDLAAEKKLLSEEEFCHDQFDTSKLQLKQYELSFAGCDDGFPPPPPEALHEYHCQEPVNKRCTSHEFMRHTGAGYTPALPASRPNTTGLHNRVDTPGRMSQYPSCLSSMATVSSNHEELAMAYHNSKVNPPGPILFESPRPLTSSLSPQSSEVTEAGIRMFTQSPPKPEESRQAVCEVPIYSTTLPSGCMLDHSSDTTDQEPRPRSTRHKSPHRRLYKRKNKRTRNQIKSREASDEISTNSDENSAYGIPTSSSSGNSDKGYGTKTKDTDDSYRTNSHNKSRDCGDLYEEEEKMSLVQTAMSAGETTPPTSQRILSDNVSSEQEKLISSPTDTKILDRYYRTVSTDHTEFKPVELYTDDYTIV